MSDGAEARAPIVDAARRRGFYALVRLLDRLGGSAPVGTASAPELEAVRFRHDPSLTFSSADVVSVRELPAADADGGDRTPRARFEVTTSFLGLAGATGPLPRYMADEVAREDPDRPRIREFLDLFHHRLVAFYYRARARSDVPAAFRPDLADPWSPRLLALLGFDAAEPPAASGLAPGWPLRVAPLFLERELTAHALESALADLLADDVAGARVQVEPFTGAWVEIAEPDRNSLGRRASRLGSDLVLGQRILDVAGRFRVTIGPLSREAYARLAAGEPVRRVEAAVAALVNQPLQHELVLWLAEDASPEVRLGAARLGVGSLLGSRRGETRVRVGRASSRCGEEPSSAARGAARGTHRGGGPA